MRILYVTDMWTALSGVLLQGDTEIKGMPAFFRVLRKLVDDGNSVDVLIYETDRTQHLQPIALTIEWLKKIRFYRCMLPIDYTGVRKPISEISKVYTIYRNTMRLLKDGKYDLVYGHGGFSEAAGLAAARFKIPFGQRRYGDSYTSYIRQYGILKAICSQPVNAWSYRRPKAFMIATNDGTSVDWLYEKLNRGRKPYPLYFWRNGYDRLPQKPEIELNLPQTECPYLLYVARLSQWKHQDRAIQLLHELKMRGITIPLYLAGQADSPDFVKSLCILAEKLNVADQIHFLGVLSLHEIAALSQKALGCLSFYDLSNFGNVFIEYFTNGGVVISLDDGSLNDVVRSGETGFLVKDMSEAATVVENLLHKPEYCEQIRTSALKTAKEYFISWEERVDKEVKLIYQTIK